MLPNTLNTNEIKNAAGTEVEFSRLQTEGRELIFNQVGESPNLKHRLTISHREVGAGVSRKRQSRIQFLKQVQGEVDTTRVENIIANLALTVPVGQLTTLADVTDLLAEMQSFVSTLGTATTVLFDGTGNGAAALINGSL
jgi:hypothetical protein